MGLGQLSKSVKEKLVNDVFKGLYAKKLTAIIDDARKKLNVVVEKDWESFDWKHIEPYRKYIFWRDSVDLDDFVLDNWSCYDWNNVLHRLGVAGFRSVTLNKSYPCEQYSKLRLSADAKKKIVEIYRSCDVLLKKIKDEIAEMKSVMASVNTASQVAELLPEVVKYLPDPVAKAFLPVPVEKVNKVRTILKGLDASGEATELLTVMNNFNADLKARRRKCVKV